MPPVEAWEKVFIDPEAFNADVHALINCTQCHGGEAVDDMATAHTGLIPDPSADPETGCGDCHPNIVPFAEESLHYTLQGYDTAIYERSVPEHYPALEEMESYHCDSCHATCGDCHISQPNSVGGGLLESHTFVETPPMSRTCTACHGSRVKNEYYGTNEGVAGDVHLRQARLGCADCHTGTEMHGMGAAADETHRYDGAENPACEDCHADQVGVGSGIEQHEIHGTELLSCQVCHSVAYTNCTNCHVDRTEDDVPFYSVEAHTLGFYIGKNTLQSGERPYRYVTVRHIPVDPESFSAYGENLLPNFLNRPTWSYATPHNIQRYTPQTTTCTSCHGNDDIFLTIDKVAQGERGGANLDVVVDGAPPLPPAFPQMGGGAASTAEETERDLSNDPSYWASQLRKADGEAEPTVEPTPEPAAEPTETAPEAEEETEPTPEPTSEPEVEPEAESGGETETAEPVSEVTSYWETLRQQQEAAPDTTTPEETED